MLLTEHLVRCETGSVDISTPWYKNCIERLQQIFLMVKYSYTCKQSDAAQRFPSQ